MNDDFEEDYEDYDERDDQITKDDIDNVKDKYNKLKERKKSDNNPSKSTEDAKNFNKNLQQQNQSRATNPSSGATQAGGAGTEGAAAGGAAAEGAAVEGVAAGGAAAAEGAAVEGAAVGGAAVAEGAAAAGGTAAAAGGAATIPVVGWVVALVIAALAVLKKIKDKIDKKAEENGINNKGILTLILLSPILLVFLIIILIVVVIAIFTQAETYDKVEFLNQAIVCFESATKTDACDDFMGTGIDMYGLESASGTLDGDPLIKKTDLEIAVFVADYVIAEWKYFGNEGSSFMTIYEEFETVAREGLEEDSTLEQITSKVESVLLLTPAGKAWQAAGTLADKINYALHLFKWLRIEKKAFNNIDWRFARVEHSSELGTLEEIITWVDHKVDGIPDRMFGDTVISDAWAKLGIHGFLDVAYLKVPIVQGADGNFMSYAIELDEAINMVHAYLPSWMEIYATYVSTGDYRLANDLYDYYLGDDIDPLQITLYQMMTIKSVEKKKGKLEEKYVVSSTEAPSIDSSFDSKEEFDEAMNEGSEGLLALAAIFDEFVALVEDFLEWAEEQIKIISGYYLTVTLEYVPAVTRGYAYDYEVTSAYNITTEHTEEVQKNKEKYYDVDSEFREHTVTEIDADGNEVEKTVIAKYDILITQWMDYYIDIWTNQMELSDQSTKLYEKEPTSTDDRNEDGARTRFEQMFVDMIKANRAKDSDYPNFTLDEISMAAEAVNGYFSMKYESSGGGNAALNIAPTGDINADMVNFARQFIGKDLAYMKSIDDTGIFLNDHWCAFFASYCMNKTGLPQVKFSSCSEFWKRCVNGNKVGFYDITGPGVVRNGGYITSKNNQKARYSDIQPGDIVLFRWDTATTARSHTGIVSNVEFGADGEVVAITTIEGNLGKSFTTSIVKEVRNAATQSRMYNIVSFLSVSTVKAHIEAGNTW